MQSKFRSTVSRRLFWCAFLASIVELAVAELLPPRGVRGFLLLATLGIAVALLFAWAISRPVDRRIARMREFAESLLDVQDRAAGRGVMDELAALDRSLLRMAAQARVLVNQAKLESTRREAILASMAEGVLAVDNQLRITFCNRAFAQLVGSQFPRTRLPASGTPLMEVVRDVTLRETLSQVMQTGQPAKRYLQIPANSRSFEVQAAPLVTRENPGEKPGGKSGDKPGAIAILHDITDLERLENVRKDFVANVSHEFRTPLAAIAGYAETLLDGAIDDKAHNRQFLEIIRANAIRLNDIASDLLTLSELTGPGMQDTEPVPIASAIESALSTVAGEAELRKVSLERGPLENAVVNGSRYRLEQALVNLLANAIKFNRPGGQVRVETRRDGTEVSIMVADTGVGIPSSDLPRIFERFYRVDKARSRQVGGTGLGLSIVRHIVERMNGRVSATSQLGKGSVFTITLPLSRS